MKRWEGYVISMVLSVLLFFALGCGGEGEVSAPWDMYDARDTGSEKIDEIPVVIGDTREEGLGFDIEVLGDNREIDLEEEAEVVDCPGNLFCPCSSNSDCFSGFCVETMYGSQCTTKCTDEDECPRGWQCAICGSSGSEYYYCCIPPFQRLCKPCKTDEDCIPATGALAKTYLCLDFGGEKGKYCGVSCDSDTECPEDFRCLEVYGSVKQCYPNSGICPCPQHYKQFETVCYINNEYGTCYGTRHCDTECTAKTPQPETCNLEDDDCNGKVDDDVPSEPCELRNNHGTCQGSTLCVNGEKICLGSYASAEACNGNDDNCDGLTDEGFSDLDNDGVADCVDMDMDGDDVPNLEDNCPSVPNPAPQRDNDGDGAGDECDDDMDGDGDPNVSDCDPLNPLVSHLAVERCNGIDDNCDGGIDEERDSSECGTDGYMTFYLDLDEDTYGSTSATKCLCSASPPYTAIRGGDCDDDDALVNPEATEACNSKDDNCNEQTDEEDAQGCVPYFYDDDRDGWGTELSRCLCAPDPQTGFTAPLSGDCNDNEATINPSAIEKCDGEDNNCNEEIDEERQDGQCGTDGYMTFYADLDGDGYGLTSEAKCLCAPAWPYVATAGGDCDDRDASIYPGATERCNNKDDNCNSITDEERTSGQCGTDGYKSYFFDYDRDNYGQEFSKCLCAPGGYYTAQTSGDCDDNDAAINPEAVERCNLKDDNCNGQIDEERVMGQCDQDGYSVWYLDSDNDTYGVDGETKCLCMASPPYRASRGGDCDDSDPTVNPDKMEVCNDAKDNDCDGQTDEPGCQGCSTYYKDYDNDGYGISSDSLCLGAPQGEYRATVGGDCDDNDALVHPSATEVCNSKDDNCNGRVDEPDAEGCVPYFYDYDQDGWGITMSRCLCAPDQVSRFTAPVSGDCNDNDANIYPGATEKCNSKDDDCNGQVDEERISGQCGTDGYSIFYFDADKDTYYGETVDKKCLCAPSGDYKGIMPGDCDDNDPTVNPGATEKCNSKDDDCDFLTDEERISGQCDIDGYETYYYDADNDTYGVTGNTKCLCSPSGNYRAARGEDCDDTDSRVYPGAPKVCGKDGDCDGSVLDPGETCDDGNNVIWDGCTECRYLEFQVNTWSPNSQIYPSVASLPSGGFVVVWSGAGQGDSSGVYGQRFDSNGDKVGSEFQVNTWTTEGQGVARVASLPGGGFVVVWESGGQDGSSYGVYGRIFPE